jgi:hypothetical protein
VKKGDAREHLPHRTVSLNVFPLAPGVSSRRRTEAGGSRPSPPLLGRRTYHLAFFVLLLLLLLLLLLFAFVDRHTQSRPRRAGRSMASNSILMVPSSCDGVPYDEALHA